MSNASSALERCAEEVNHPRVVVKAHGRMAAFLNPEGTKIKKVDVDCWLSNAETPKADYVICKPNAVDVIVELKGKDIDHGVEQILATFTHWKKTPSCSAKIGGLIVFTRSPERSATLGAIKARLFARHEIWLEMGKSGLKEYEFETFTGAPT